ncbi:MAG: hypothetical protein K9L30_04715 [Desulfobacterales bacterium]|nr:hypothetical protein [Desulfobacterales bacterium]
MKIRIFRILCYTTLFNIMLFSFSYADSADLVETYNNGIINWTLGIIEAKGNGIPENNTSDPTASRQAAISSARRDAQLNLFEVSKNLRISSVCTVNDIISNDDTLKRNLIDLIENTDAAAQEFLSDGTAVITVRMSIYGGFSQLLLPMEIKQIETIKSVNTSGTEPVSKNSDLPTAPDNRKNDIFTGLIVDARGINAKPCMAPKITDEAGNEVYGPAFASREFAVHQGMSGFRTNLQETQPDSCHSEIPFVVKGLRTLESSMTDIVISNADALRINSASENLSILKECRVMIVIND